MRLVTRRAVLGGLLAAPLLGACAGFDTSGAEAPGTVGFLSTQFTPVEERQRYEQVLRSQLTMPVAYNPVEGGVFTTTIRSQAQAHNVRTALIGGLYNDLAPLADAFDDVGGLLGNLSGAGYPEQILKLTTLGGPTPKFVPWMQATYIVAVNTLLRLEFRTELKKIVQDLGTTTVYVTHDQGEALSLGDRVAVMRAGRIVQLGDPIGVYDSPAERFVGGFLGSPPMNFLAAKVDPNGTALHVADDTVPAPRQAGAHAGRDVLLGVRPENVEVSTEAGDLDARVEVLEPTGSAMLLTVDVGDESLKVVAPASFRARPGDVVHLTFPPDAIRLYDAETHAALAD